MAFKNLPRLTFGNLQAKLFPIYFKVLTGSAVVVLVVYAAKHAADGRLANKSGASLQLAALAGTLVFTLMNLLVLGAPCLVLVLYITYLCTCTEQAAPVCPALCLPASSELCFNKALCSAGKCVAAEVEILQLSGSF